MLPFDHCTSAHALPCILCYIQQSSDPSHALPSCACSLACRVETCTCLFLAVLPWFDAPSPLLNKRSFYFGMPTGCPFYSPLFLFTNNFEQDAPICPSRRPIHPSSDTFDPKSGSQLILCLSLLLSPRYKQVTKDKELRRTGTRQGKRVQGWIGCRQSPPPQQSSCFP